MKKEINHKQNYEEFWKDLVETDGVLDLDKIQRELSDYHFMLEEVPKVYCSVSGGMISKPNTYAFEVIGEFDKRFDDKEITKDDVGDMIKTATDLDSLKEELRDYFGIIFTP